VRNLIYLLEFCISLNVISSLSRDLRDSRRIPSSNSSP